MIIYPWPLTYRPATCTFRIATRSTFGASPMRAGRRVYGAVIEQWTVEMSFPDLGPDYWRPLKALIGRLRGPQNAVRLWDPSRHLPLGAAAGLNLASTSEIGDPFSDGTRFADGFGWSTQSAFGSVVAAAPLGARDVVMGGLVPSQAVSLAEADLFELGGWLYEVSMTASSNASGQAVVSFQPGLRAAVVPGDVVRFAFPTSPFQLADDDQGRVDIQAPMFGSIGFSATEALPG